MKIFVETDRLILREIHPIDVEGIYRLESDPEVHRYLGNKPITSKQQIVNSIRLIRQQYIDYGIGRWAIIEKKTNEFVGWTGIRYVTYEMNNHKNFYDLSYRLVKRYWGQGIATETALASLQYVFYILCLSKVYAMAECQNIRSNKILKKVGLKFIETFEFESIMHNWYSINNADF